MDFNYGNSQGQLGYRYISYSPLPTRLHIQSYGKIHQIDRPNRIGHPWYLHHQTDSSTVHFTLSKSKHCVISQRPVKCHSRKLPLTPLPPRRGFIKFVLQHQLQADGTVYSTVLDSHLPAPCLMPAIFFLGFFSTFSLFVLLFQAAYIVVYPV